MIHLGRPDSSVGSVGSSDLQYSSATHVLFLEASLAKEISISETIIKIVPVVVYINGFTVTHRFAVSLRPNPENCTGCSPPIDSRCLRSRLA